MTLRKNKPFENPIFVTRPLLPDLISMNKKLEEVWASKWLTNNGPQHQIFESKIKEVLKVPYVSIFNNGTIALIVACQSLRLSGEVITTPFTFPATPHVLTWNGIKPIFCDIDPVTMNIDASKLESMITPSTTGILAVHIFGTPCDVKNIQKIANKYGLKVIYDGAPAFKVEIEGEGIGNFGDISMFSFHATKLFHTAEGGALTFKDPNLKPRIDLLKNFGIKNEEEVVLPGINGKMNEIQAVLGISVLEYVETEIQKRKELTEVYRRCLKDVEGVTLLGDRPGVKGNYQYFVIKINENLFGKSRDFVYEQFKKYNIFTRKYYYPLCSNYTCYRQLPSSSSSNLPVANEVVKQNLCFPLYGELSSENVEKICEIFFEIRDQ